MRHNMADSVNQRSFFGPSGMHYMSQAAITADCQTEDVRLHDQHLALQDRMTNPIAFHAEMMGDISQSGPEAT